MEVFASNNSGIYFDINSDRYLSHHSNIFIEKLEKLPTKAYDVDIIGKRKNIIGVLGEFFEREILINANSIREKKLIAYNLRSKEVKYIDSKKIVFEDEFVDSCGMASHIDSRKIIWTAFKEFFERQCLITSYLSENRGIEIDFQKTRLLYEYDQYIKNFVDEVNYFNISLCEDIHVIIAIGLGSQYNAVGIGTDTHIKDAVKKAQKEILQHFASDKSKFDKNLLDESKVEYEYMDNYHALFNSMINADIYREYKYLYTKSKKVMIDEIQKKERDYGINYILQSIHNNLNMNPYVVIIPSFRNIPNLKIVKVFDENWFPHMNIKLFEESDYTRVSNFIKVKLSRDKKVLPFA